MSETRRLRYCRQPQSHTCGPTAILNALKWAGYPCTLKQDYEYLVDECDCSKELGTSSPDFDRVLRNELKDSVSVRLKYRPTLREIEWWVSHLGHIVVLLYWHKNPRPGNDAHYMLVTDAVFQRRAFKCINDTISVSYRDRDRMKMYINTRRRAKKDVPAAWFLKHNEV